MDTLSSPLVSSAPHTLWPSSLGPAPCQRCSGPCHSRLHLNPQLFLSPSSTVPSFLPLSVPLSISLTRLPSLRSHLHLMGLDILVSQSGLPASILVLSVSLSHSWHLDPSLPPPFRPQLFPLSLLLSAPVLASYLVSCSTSHLLIHSCPHLTSPLIHRTLSLLVSPSIFRFLLSISCLTSHCGSHDLSFYLPTSPSLDLNP